jgi:hypothetical protein
MRWATFALPLLLAAALAGCGGEERAAEEPGAPLPATTAAGGETAGVELAEPSTTTLTVYFTRGEQVGAAHRVVPKTEQPGAAAIEALLAGPAEAEREAGLGSEIPEGTRFLGLSIEATFMYFLEDVVGNKVVEDFATATSGSGERGTFDVTVPFTVDVPGAGRLVVFESSAEDGSPIHVVEIPLEFEP